MKKVRIDEKLRDKFYITSSFKQWDKISATLFIIAFHKAVHRIDQRGTIFDKSTQIFAYADEMVIIARTKDRLKQTKIWK